MSIALKGANLIDGRGGKPLEEVIILIEGDKINSILPESQIDLDPNVEIIEVRGKTVMPGLIDAHVHLEIPAVSDRLTYLIKTPPALVAFYAAHNARITLEAGFTTLRDAGGPAVLVSLRDAIKLGLVSGPRLLTSGVISMTAGHGDAAMGKAHWPASLQATADGVDEVRKRVREHVRTGFDWIKIFTSGGVLSEGDESWWRNYTLEEINAITDEAHALGKRVAAHAHGTEGIKNAIKGGVDTIEHGIYLDEEVLEMMLEKQLFLVATMTIGRAFLNRAGEAGLPDLAIRKGHMVMEVVMENMAKAYAAGVRIALGTDCSGNLARAGENAMELELMTEIGMSPMEAIVAATKNAAEAIGLGDTIGTLELGKKADLIVVDGDPLKDIQILQDKEKILMVIKEGRILVDRRGDNKALQESRREFLSQ
jgi:imidazolonepropionase-like amidohydrolase